MATRHQRDEIESYLNTLLEVDRFTDYGPNGLQVEGRAEVRRRRLGGDCEPGIDRRGNC